MSPEYERLERGGGEGKGKRSLGRPRSPRVEGAILDATLELLAEEGLAGVSIEAVAARAGVSKAAIYRRWASREEVVAAAFRSVTSTFEPPDTGNVRNDLIALLVGFQHSTLRAVPGHLIPRLITSTVSNRELLHVFWANVYAPRRDALLTVLRHGVERGELRPELDLALCSTMIIGPLLHAALLDVETLSSDLPVRLIDTLLAGVAAQPRD